MEIKYAGFLVRAFSIIIDTVLLIPFQLFVQYSMQTGRINHCLLYISWMLFTWIVYLFLLYKFGGTPGKLLVGIRIRKLNSEKAGLKEVLLRSAVDIIFCFTLGIAYLIAINHLDFYQYLEMHGKIQAEYLNRHYPVWQKPIALLQIVWVLSELVVLLFNKQKMAIHDFIAGTVVIHMPLKMKEIKESFYKMTSTQGELMNDN